MGEDDASPDPRRTPTPFESEGPTWPTPPGHEAYAERVARIPSWIGGYRVVSLLGEGGMGAVYLAEQEKPHRRVALKLMRPGATSERALRRFEHEAELLGRLVHPGIAQIYEAGLAEGVPFFAMELVEGRTLLAYCDEKRMGARERLALFARICDAVHHAHTRGVIHRDLKPGNILVTEVGTPPEPQPKILDFGVARATDAGVGSTTMRTDAGEIIGTLPYMSPEQVGGDNQELDTRSDVYSLGVVLYELLSGRMPYDLGRRMIHEAARIIKEEEPARLSSIDRALRGDVETILSKAMAKEKSRRYQSAESLGGDIRRYLRDEPIDARPASAWYQASKFARRHRALVAGAGATVVVLVAGLVGTSYGLSEAVIARDDESEQRVVAEAVAEFQTDMLAAADPDQLFGDEVTVLQVMQAAVKELDAGSLRDQPLVEAGVRDTIGNTLLALARYDEAEPNLHRAVELYRGELPPEHPNIAYALNNLATLLHDQYRLAEAEPLYRESLDILRKAHPKGHFNVSQGLDSLARLLVDQNKLPEAEAHYREALDMLRKTRPAGDPDIATGLNNLALLLTTRKNFIEAEPLLREAVDINRKTLPAAHPHMAPALHNLSQILGEQGKFAEAEALGREALEIARATLPVGHPSIASVLNNLSSLLLNQSKVAEAELLSRESVEIVRAALPEGHPEVAKSLNVRASVLQAQEKFEEAEPLHHEVLAIFRAALPPEHPGIASALNNLGVLLKIENRLREAEPLIREALEIRRSALPAADPLTLGSMYGLAEVLIGLGRSPEAAPLIEECIDGYAATLGNEHQSTRDAIRLAVTLYESWNNAEPGKGYDAKAAEWKAKIASEEGSKGGG